MTPGRSLCDGSRESQPLSASKSKVNMTATRAPLGQGEVMREPPGLEAKWAHRTRSGGVSLRQCRRRPPGAGGTIAVGRSVARGRSEEHTSELQSPCNLVCRLLLEKKKKRLSLMTVRL